MHKYNFLNQITFNCLVSFEWQANVDVFKVISYFFDSG
jgi:hypothetical protein